MLESFDLASEILTISDLNRLARDIIETNLPLIWVEGEISNFTRPRSGHCYFSLKDEKAQVRCAMFRGRNHALEFEPKDGMHVLAQARVSLYEPRGDFQLIIEHLEETGFGALQRAFEQLKKRLANEGLFDSRHKKPLPKLPKQIGVITSPTGAAVRDVLTVLKRRFPSLSIIIYPTQVQGDLAAPQIVQAIHIANQRDECDVLLLVRGGGSLEDLWPFNEETVARAIFDSEIPIVSGVGHEIDITISDFVSDQRAATPSAAAELVSPDRKKWQQNIDYFEMRLIQRLQTQLQHHQMHLTNLSKRLQHPGRKLLAQAQQLDDLERKLILAIQHLARHEQSNLYHMHAQLLQHIPTHLIKIHRNSMRALTHRLLTADKVYLDHKHQRLAQLAADLNAISPLQVLKRGYAIVQHHKKVLRTIKKVGINDRIHAQLIDGSLVCRVEGKHENEKFIDSLAADCSDPSTPHS